MPFGSEPGFRRPVLIIQDDAFNRSNIRTTMVVPLTTNLSLAEAPGNVFLEKEESGLSKDSVVVVSQLSVLDKDRLVESVGSITAVTLSDIEEGIKIVLGIA